MLIEINDNGRSAVNNGGNKWQWGMSGNRKEEQWKWLTKENKWKFEFSSVGVFQMQETVM